MLVFTPFFLAAFVQLVRFPDAVHQRLLHTHMLTVLDGLHGRREMGVIGSGHGDHVNLVAHGREHFLEALKGLRMGILKLGCFQRLAINIAERHDVCAFCRDSDV